MCVCVSVCVCVCVCVCVRERERERERGGMQMGTGEWSLLSFFSFLLLLCILYYKQIYPE